MTNRRHAIFGYLLYPILLWFVNNIRKGTFRKFQLSFFKFSLIIISTYFVFGPLTDFSLAMSALRSRVFEIGGKELLLETWNTYKDKDALDAQYRFFQNEQINFSTIDTRVLNDNKIFNVL